MAVVFIVYRRSTCFRIQYSGTTSARVLDRWARTWKLPCYSAFAAVLDNAFHVIGHVQLPRSITRRGTFLLKVRRALILPWCPLEEGTWLAFYTFSLNEFDRPLWAIFFQSSSIRTDPFSLPDISMYIAFVLVLVRHGGIQSWLKDREMWTRCQLS